MVSVKHKPKLVGYYYVKYNKRTKVLFTSSYAEWNGDKFEGPHINPVVSYIPNTRHRLIEQCAIKTKKLFDLNKKITSKKRKGKKT